MNNEDPSRLNSQSSWTLNYSQPYDDNEKKEDQFSFQLAVPFMQEDLAKLENSPIYQEMFMMYTCAMKAVSTKFDILNTEFNAKLQRNPIKNISARLKNARSLMEKMNRLQIPLSRNNIQEHIFDVAGIRIICSYIDDIYKIGDALLAQKDITLIQKKDYIASPKPNGYRSLHLIVSVPVYLSSRCVNVAVEVQIRTLAMDFWASLEHQLKYKKVIANEDLIYAQLKECAESIHETDEKMLSIRRQLEAAALITPSAESMFQSLVQPDYLRNPQ